MHFGEQHVLIHWFWAMALFMRLSLLLLATIQPPSVSVTRICLKEEIKDTLTFSPEWSSALCCSDDGCECARMCSPNVSMSVLHMSNLEHNKSYCCRNASNHECSPYVLEVGRGCMEPHINGIDFSEGQEPAGGNKTEALCSARCNEDPHCEYFTFNRETSQCFLMSACDIEVIRLDPNTVSGSFLKNSCSEMTDDAGLHFHPAAKSWIDALEHCHDTNSSLVHVTNEHVQEAVTSLLQRKMDSVQNGVWIGLERTIIGKVSWMWTSGSKVGNFQSWNDSFPVDCYNNHCGKIIWIKELQKFKWLDASCHEELPFICKAPVTT